MTAWAVEPAAKAKAKESYGTGTSHLGSSEKSEKRYVAPAPTETAFPSPLIVDGKTINGTSSCGLDGCIFEETTALGTGRTFKDMHDGTLQDQTGKVYAKNAK